MACNCKNKINAIDKKYGDGNNNDGEKLNPILRIIQFIAQLCFGVICGAIIIVLIIPILIYIILCMMFGKDANIRLINPKKFLNKDRK